MGESTTMQDRHSEDGGRPAAQAQPVSGELDRPLSTLALCALAAALAFGLPMWVSSVFDAGPPTVEGVESDVSLQSFSHTLSVRPPTPGQIVPPRLRLVVPPEMKACIDPRAWPGN